MAATDVYYHPPCAAEQPHCSCLTNPAAGAPLISLTHSLQNTIEQLRQLPEHAPRGQPHCVILARITQLNDLMQYVPFSLYA